MDKRIDKIKKIRQHVISQIADLSCERLNNIPQGHNNNIIWNMVHMMSSQQGLCYRRLGKAAVIPDEYVLPFQTNTKPDRVVDNSEIEEIKKMFVSSIDRLQDDYQAGIFHDDTLSPGSYKIYDIEMRDIGDALEVLLYHEGYHTGRIVRLKQLVA